jgi:hypothetical protein
VLPPLPARLPKEELIGRLEQAIAEAMPDKTRRAPPAA